MAAIAYDQIAAGANSAWDAAAAAVRLGESGKMLDGKTAR